MYRDSTFSIHALTMTPFQITPDSKAFILKIVVLNIFASGACVFHKPILWSS